MAFADGCQWQSPVPTQRRCSGPPGLFVSRVDSNRGSPGSQFLMIDNAGIGASLLTSSAMRSRLAPCLQGAKPPRGGAVGAFSRTPSGSAHGHADRAGLSVWVALRSNANLAEIVGATGKLTLHIAPVNADGTTLAPSQPLVAEFVRIVYLLALAFTAAHPLLKPELRGPT